MLEEKIHHVVPPFPLFAQIVGFKKNCVFTKKIQFVAHNIESKLDYCGKQQSSFLNSHNHLFFLKDQ